MTKNQKDGLCVLISKTFDEWLVEADEYAQTMVHLNATDAWKAVNRGEFGGLETPFANELEQLVCLAGIADDDEQLTVLEVDGGWLINGDCTSEIVRNKAVELSCGSIPLIVTDPPYGKIVKEDWDKTDMTDDEFAEWMVEWTNLWEDALVDGGAFYVWGGLGTVGFRPFLKYISRVERPGKFEMSTMITWSKRRAYGIQWSYIFTREECAMFIKGDKKKPRTFNVPLLDTKRGYAGYNKKYPAKSEFYRRTNVWTDINEMFKGKLHPTQKSQRLYEVMIEAHTMPGEFVVDMFAGSGVCGLAARKLGRKFVLIEKDEKIFKKMVETINS